MHSAAFPYALSGLPDPERDAQFYEGVLSKRLVAWFVDVLAIMALALPVVLAVGILTLGLGFIAAPVLITAVAFAYRTLTIAQSSATWGMQAMGIELRQGDGQRFDLTHAALHTLIFFLLMASLLGWGASMVAMLVTARKQGLGDLLLGSTAINAPVE